MIATPHCGKRVGKHTRFSLQYLKERLSTLPKTNKVFIFFSGIAFDQGKTLHTAETVPFRLTQDIISGFGLSGAEGIFRG